MVKDQYSHFVYPGQHSINDKPVKIWAQLVIKFARDNERKNTLDALLCTLSDA